jgi:PAS domain S-box-containing protein
MKQSNTESKKPEINPYFSALFQKRLTPRELKIAELLVAGDSTLSIKETLAITNSTLKTHLRHIYHKAGVTNRLAFTLSMLKGISGKEALNANTKRLQAFIQHSQDGIIIINRHGIIVEWNKGEEQITGIRQSEALGQPLWQIQYKLSPEGQSNPDFKLIAQEKMMKGIEEGPDLKRVLVEEIQRPDGSKRKIQSIIFAVPYDNQILAGAITRDITETK